MADKTLVATFLFYVAYKHDQGSTVCENIFISVIFLIISFITTLLCITEMFPSWMDQVLGEAIAADYD